MKSLLALLPLAALVLAGPGDEDGHGILVHDGKAIRYDVHCETSGASPYLHHIHEAADKIDTDWDNFCVQGNSMGSHCTTLKKSVGGVISICGPDKGHYEIRCKEVDEMARLVAEHCEGQGDGKDRAGGYVYREVRTWSSPGVRHPAAWVEVSTNS